MAKLETLKVSELIGQLYQILKESGDLPVIHSRDEEGNGYNTVMHDSVCYMDTDKIGKVVCLFPYAEGIENEIFNEWF
jgi:hypothetical protein